jgi:hypothetical protein
MPIPADFDDRSYVGRPHEEVVAELKLGNPERVIHAVGNDMMVTMGYRLDRMRVRYDRSTGKVTSVRVG